MGARTGLTAPRTVTIMVAGADLDRIAAWAETFGISRGEIIRRCIRRYLTEVGEP